MPTTDNVNVAITTLDIVRDAAKLIELAKDHSINVVYVASPFAKDAGAPRGWTISGNVD